MIDSVWLMSARLKVVVAVQNATSGGTPSSAGCNTLLAIKAPAAFQDAKV